NTTPPRPACPGAPPHQTPAPDPASRAVAPAGSDARNWRQAGIRSAPESMPGPVSATSPSERILDGDGIALDKLRRHATRFAGIHRHAHPARMAAHQRHAIAFTDDLVTARH